MEISTVGNFYGILQLLKVWWKFNTVSKTRSCISGPNRHLLAFAAKKTTTITFMHSV